MEQKQNMSAARGSGGADSMIGMLYVVWMKRRCLQGMNCKDSNERKNLCSSPSFPSFSFLTSLLSSFLPARTVCCRCSYFTLLAARRFAGRNLITSRSFRPFSAPFFFFTFFHYSSSSLLPRDFIDTHQAGEKSQVIQCAVPAIELLLRASASKKQTQVSLIVIAHVQHIETWTPDDVRLSFSFTTRFYCTPLNSGSNERRRTERSPREINEIVIKC